MLKYILILFVFTSFLYAQDFDHQSPGVHIDLINPSWSQSIFSTFEGGVIYDSNVRIQAKKIKYRQLDNEGKPISLVQASGNLMVEKDGKIFIGDSFEYDFNSKIGTLNKGRVALDIWFLKSKTILFQENNDVVFKGAILTTCESEFHYWKLVASEVKVSNGNYLTASNVRFQVGVIPFFWVPFFKTDLNAAKSPSLGLTLRLGGKKDNKLGIRYRIWDNDQWSTYFRLAYPINRGFGGGIELNYVNALANRNFVSQTFYAKDNSLEDSKKRNRYQLVGKFNQILRGGKTSINAEYDKTSDDSISQDYYANSYKIQNIGNTYIKINNREPFSIQTLKFQYRVNNFQTVKQELPSLQVNLKAISISPLKAFIQSQIQAEYLDFTYAKGTPGIREYSAPRLRLTTLLHRPFYIAPVAIAPYGGISTAFYGNSPEKKSITNYFFRYGVSIKTQIYKRYNDFQHAIYPFMDYYVITPPSKSLSSLYIFDYEDAFSQIRMLTYGIRQSIYSNTFLYYPQKFQWSLFAHVFLGKTATKKRTPRIYNHFTWHPLPKLSLFLNMSYYRLRSMFDLVNSGFSYTVNNDFAFRAEIQHRTKYSWLKANPDSFILDVTRSEKELLNSALSKPQNSLITSSHFRLHPSCSLLLETRNGWKRNQYKPYTEWKTAIELLLKCHWKLELSIEHTSEENRFGLYFSLLDAKGKMNSRPPMW
jgi:hypothetical protein